MATASRKRSYFTLIGVTLMASVLFALSTGATASPAVASAPSLDGVYGCSDRSVIKIKWTRQMPENGWLGDITTYEGGNVVTKGMQAYAPQYGSSGQVRWGYQRQDGSILCRSMLVLGGGRDITWSQCRNWPDKRCTFVYPATEAEP